MRYGPVPCSLDVKQGCPLSPKPFLFVTQVCLESLERAMPAEAKQQFRTNKLTSTKDGKMPGTDWFNKGEFEFGF